MEHEIEMFGRQRGRLDERILTLMDEIETTTTEVARLREERDAAQAAWEKQVAHYKREAARIQAELSRLVPERQAVAGTIEPRTLQRYEELRRRSGNLAATRIREGICGACRVNIQAAVLRQVREGERYVFCDNCGRFLFAPME